MKIDRHGVKGVAGPQRPDAARPSAPAERTTGTQGVSPADHVVLSSRTLQVSELQPALGMLPAVRADLIQDLKERIARGEYSVEPKALADALLRVKVIDE